MTDTPAEIAQMLRSLLMARSGAERMRMGAEMFEAARRMALASFPPGLDAEERKHRLFQRLYGMPWPGEATQTAAKGPASALPEIPSGK